MPSEVSRRAAGRTVTTPWQVDLDCLPWPAVVIDLTALVVAVNGAWTGLGLPAAPVMGRCYLEWCAGALGEETARTVASRFAAIVLDPGGGPVVVDVEPPATAAIRAIRLAGLGDHGGRVLVVHDDGGKHGDRMEAASAREELWRSLFLGNPAVMLLIDPATGRILDASAGASRFYGYPVTDLQGMDIGAINLLPAAEIRHKLDEAVAAPDGTRRFRFPHRLASGEVRQVEVLTARVRLGGQSLLQSVVHDVTEQAQAESHRDLLATAVEETGEAVVITDSDARIVYVNPAFERVSGYSAADVAGRNPRLLQSGVHSAAYYEGLWRVLASGRTWVGEFTNRRPDGTTYIEEGSISPVYDERGGLMHYVAVKRDVTRERSERAAREQLASIVDSAADAVCAVGLDGTLVAWNDAASRVFGLDRDQVLGHRVFDFIRDSLGATMAGWIATVARGATVGPLDASIATPAGDRILSVTATPIRDGGGGVTAVAAIARDVTGERRLAAEREQLEHQLRQAQKMEALGRLAGGVAHDFNNLLTAIQGFASLVAPVVGTETRQDVDQILLAASRGRDLTRRLLSFSRAVPLEPRAIDLDAALHAAWHLVTRLVPERIDLELSARSGACVVIDPVEIDQLVMNLVCNAVDAIPTTGRVRVVTAMAVGPARHGSTASSHVVLTVEDDGNGMDEATRRRVFEPFFTTKAEGVGTGLGLANVFAIVERAHGLVEVASEPGSGSRFTIRLPPAPRAAPADEPADEPADVSRPQPRLERPRVLLVDDSPLVLRLAARILESGGYAVVAAGTPAEALGLELAGISAIVTDVVMPGLSGPALVERLDLGVPVVFTSGYADAAVDADPAAVPARVLLAKPFSAQDLLGALEPLIAPA